MKQGRAALFVLDSDEAAALRPDLLVLDISMRMLHRDTDYMRAALATGPWAMSSSLRLPLICSPR